jgi:adenylate cyclase
MGVLPSGRKGGQAGKKKALKCAFPGSKFFTASAEIFCCSRRSSSQQRMSTIPHLATSLDQSLPAPTVPRRYWPLRGFDLRRWDARTWDTRTWRNNLRLTSALVLLSFVICHLLAHCLLIVSLDAANVAFDVTMYAWQTKVGTALLLAAFFVHYGNALWSIYVRQSLRLAPWQWVQVGLGLSIPLLILNHVMGTGVADNTLGVVGSYQSVLIAHWVAAPWHAILQTAAVLTIWTHACIGIHFWLRTKPAYARWRPYLLGFALLLPTIALAGYIAAGNEVLRASRNPDYVAQVLRESHVTPQTGSEVLLWAQLGIGAHLAMIGLAFGARELRLWRLRNRKLPRLTHASGRVMPILAGASVLETLRQQGVPHAALCGGRARCTTCRVLVTKGVDALAPASGLEADALARISATPGMRLACQLRPDADISIMPLLAPDAGAVEGSLRGGLEGSERLITVVFVDMRGSTSLGENKLPYDVLFILNRFFQEMSKAVAATNGHYSQFTGDGLMALYGLDAADPTTGPADALRGAQAMLAGLGDLNHQLRGELSAPLRIGIGIHYGEAIVGAMGPPRSQIITAIGDTVNTCARLESLTKDYDCVAIVSQRAAALAGLDVTGRELLQASVKGRSEPVRFYALKTLAELSTAAQA